MDSLPPGVTLSWEILGPMALQRPPLADATLSLWLKNVARHHPLLNERLDPRRGATVGGAGQQLGGEPYASPPRAASSEFR